MTRLRRMGWNERFAALVVIVLLAAGWGFQTAGAGGWAVVTLVELPQGVVAERPFAVTFAVRQHGQQPLGGLSPTVTAVDDETGTSVTAVATETGATGVYTADLTLPTVGTWRWSIEAFTAVYPMPPLTVQGAAAETQPASGGSWLLAIGLGGLVAALGMAVTWRRQPGRLRLAGLALALIVGLVSLGWYAQRPSTLAAQVDEVEAETAVGQGEALFVAKGCTQCHQNDRVTLEHNHFAAVGPNLTQYKASAEFLQLWLADPPAVKPETLMPDLDLSKPDIEALTAFLLGGTE